MGKETATSRWGLQRVGEREIKVGKERDKTVLTAQPIQVIYTGPAKTVCPVQIAVMSTRCKTQQQRVHPHP